MSLAQINRIAAQDRRRGRAYEAYGAARRLWACKDEEILIEGPAGTGKTRAILEKIHFILMKYPGSRGLLVRKTRVSLTETVLVTFEEKVLPVGSPLLGGQGRAFRQKYVYPNGSELIVGGMDKPQKVMSSEYDVIGCFESTELTQEDFENLTTRLRNYVVPYQQIICDCNPSYPKHWLNLRPKTAGMTRLLSRHEDNPVLFDMKLKQWTPQGEKYMKKLERLSGPRYLRLRKGIWASAEGLVYPDFDANIHMINRDELPAGFDLWTKIRSIDFGYRDPFVCQWWAISPDDVMYLYREIYMSGKLVKDHAEVIKELSEGEIYEATICDHDLEGRKTLDELKIFSVPAYKDIDRGLDAVRARLKPQPPYNKPALVLVRDSLVEMDQSLADENHPTSTEDEFSSYSYPKGQDGKPKKEKPVDMYNHGMDAMRYAVAYRDQLHTYFAELEVDETGVVYAHGNSR